VSGGRGGRKAAQRQGNNDKKKEALPAPRGSVEHYLASQYIEASADVTSLVWANRLPPPYLMQLASGVAA